MPAPYAVSSDLVSAWPAKSLAVANYVDSALAAKSDYAPTQNTQTGTGASAYTFVLADATPVYGPDTYRFTPPLLVRGRVARPGDADSTRLVRLRIPNGTARVLTGGEARMDM